MRVLPDYRQTPLGDLINHKAEAHLCNFCQHVEVCALADQLSHRFGRLAVVIDQCAQFQADHDQATVQLQAVPPLG